MIRSALLLAIFLISVLPSTAQLSGTYSIDPSGAGDYLSFNAAVADLELLGVSDTVIMQAVPGTYSERIVINNIPGTSLFNPVFFTSTTEDSTSVVITYPASSSLTEREMLVFDGCANIQFEHLTIQRTGSNTYGDLIAVTGGSSDIHIDRCTLIGVINTSANSQLISVFGNSDIDQVRMENNRIVNTGPAHVSGINGGGNFTLLGNEFINCTGALVSILNPDVQLALFGNIINMDHDGPGQEIAIALTTVTRSVFLTYNEIRSGLSNAKGMLVTDCAWDGASTIGQVQNNNFIMTGQSSVGIEVADNVSNLYLWSNSVSMTSQSGTTGLYVYGASGTDIDARNNIFFSGGSAINIDEGSRIGISDHNLYWSSTMDPITWEGTMYASTFSLNASSGLDANSVIGDPLFVDPSSDLHILPTSAAIGNGTVVPFPGPDFDAEFRPLPLGTDPDIGADELDDCSPLAGTYFIGTSAGADYTTLSAAVNELANCGMSAPVTFQMEAGLYNEQVSIPFIGGSSVSNTLTLRGVVGNSDQVVITHPSSNLATDNYTLQLNGAQYVTIEHLTIERTGTLDNHIALDLAEGPAASRTSTVTINSCRILRDPSLASVALGFNQGSIDANDLESDRGDCVVRNTYISGGKTGILWRGEDNPSSLLLENNTIEHVEYGIFLWQYWSGPVEVRGNRISTDYASVSNFGIYVLAGRDDILIDGNDISIEGEGSCLQFENTEGIGLELVVSNNFFQATANPQASGVLKGISAVVADSIQFVHNTIVSHDECIKFFSGLPPNNSVGNTLVNNILYSTASVVLDHEDSPYSVASNNILYAPASADLAIIDGIPLADLTALQASTGLFSSCLETDPLLVDALNDLRLTQSSPGIDQGLTLATVTSDFFGRTRPYNTASDIGAHEYTCEPLFGTYVIGSSGAADYATINAAVTDLIDCGISSAVIFEIETGTYSERITLPLVTGVSASNTITFRSQSGNAADVTIDDTVIPADLSTAVFDLRNSRWLRLEDITVQRSGSSPTTQFLIRLDNAGDFNLEGCVMSITAGTPGIAIFGNFSPDIGVSRIMNNIIDGDNGISISSCMGDSLYINNNVFSTVDNAISLTDNSLSSVVRGNTVDLGDHGLSNFRNGAIFKTDENGSILCSGNLIRSDHAFKTGIGVYDNGWTSSPDSSCVVVNNMIILSGSSSRGIRVYGDAGNTYLMHNSISVQGGTSGRIGMELSGSAGVLELFNNSVVADDEPMMVNASALVSASDGNTFWSVGGDPIDWNGSHTTIATLNSATGFDANSQIADPLYSDPLADLHLTSGSPCIASGVVLTAVSDDFDGELRPGGTAPDCGADQFSIGPMSGSYSAKIGAGGDYPSLGDAVSDLITRGVDGPVVIDIDPGVYTEKLLLTAIAGASSTNTITFKGDASDSTAVKIEWPSTGFGLGETLIDLDGAQHLRFEHLSLERTGTGSEARIFQLRNNASDIEVTSCHIISSTSTSLTGSRNLLRTLNVSDIGSSYLTDCYLERGAGVHLDGVLNGSFLMKNNVFDNSRYGLLLSGVECSVTCEDNQMDLSGSLGSSYGVSVSGGSTGTLVIQRNLITSSSIAFTGVRFNDAPWSGISGEIAFVLNNMIIASGSSSTGVQVGTNVGRFTMYHNSIRMNGSSFSSQVCLQTTDPPAFPTPFWIIGNNIFSSGSKTISIADASGVSYCDHNIYYSDLGQDIEWNGVPYSTISALNAATGTNGNSIIDDPYFLDPFSDLHIEAASPAIERALPLPGIPTDFDGDARPTASTPDIGADEVGPLMELDLSVFLQGPYDPISGLMKTDLLDNGHLPLTEPYSALGYWFETGQNAGMSTALVNATGPDRPVDWIVVEVMDEFCGCEPLNTIPAIVTADGSVVDTTGGTIRLPSFASNGHVRVSHRNHLTTMTAQPILISSDAPAYDMTDGSTPAYGVEGQKDLNGTFMMWAGDVSGDGELKYIGTDNDRDIILQNIGGSIPTNTTSGYQLEDVNLDGDVKYIGSDNDRDIILQNIGGSVPTNTRSEQVLGF